MRGTTSEAQKSPAQWSRLAPPTPVRTDLNGVLEDDKGYDSDQEESKNDFRDQNRCFIHFPSFKWASSASQQARSRERLFSGLIITPSPTP